ncbi:hypothetical protein KQX54_016075 [Cotesia glomerata]|uniref:Uncharacterized protein n=1 Tax=Cotesia glomerata TaxID=32391 RepID=A0AAV7I9L2_COTGL|nr:hypothetical protein KQX54_016075 [Cotesia glomerata]
MEAKRRDKAQRKTSSQEMSQGAKTRQDLTYQPPPGLLSSPVETDSLVIAFVSSTPSRVLFSILVNFRRGIWVDSNSTLLL